MRRISLGNLRSSVPLAPCTFLQTSERLRSGFSLALLCLLCLVFLQKENSSKFQKLQGVVVLGGTMGM